MWSFLNPMFLWALGAATIPLLLHLMQKRRIVTVRFSSIRFLKMAQKRSSNRIRMENFLLWLLRTLMMLLIALGFAMPVLKITSFRQIMGASRRDVAIVWDISYSMGYMSGSKKVWNSAKDTLTAILAGLHPGDRVCVFLADDDVTPLIEQPTADLDMALAQIKAQAVSTTASSLRPALMEACNALKESQRREREIHIVTDGQQLPWTDFTKSDRPTVPEPAVTNAVTDSTPAGPADRPPWNAAFADPDITFFVTAMGVAAPENTAPLDVEVQPALVMADSPAKLLVKLGHTGPAQSTAVALILDDQNINRHSLTINNQASESIVFVLPPLTTGVHTGRIETPLDGLGIDNTFYFLLRVSQKLPVVCVGTDANTFFLMRALNPSEKFAAMETRRIDTDALGNAAALKDAVCVFLCNAIPMSGQALMTLEHYVQRGGLAVMFPGDRGHPADYASWNFLPAQPQAIEEVPAANQRRVLRLVKPGDPLFAGMKLPPGTFPTLTINREIVWKPLAPSADTVIAAGNERPFLLRRAVGQGHVFCFSVSADRRWSTLPLSPFFLPMVHQLVQYGATIKKEPMFLWTGRNIILNAIMGSVPDNTELQGPAEATIKIHKLKSGTDTVMSVERLNQPGIYHLSTPGQAAPAPVMAVNVMRTESDLTRINLTDIPALLGVKRVKVAESKDDLLRLIKEHRVGRPLGEQLLWLAFIIGILELFIANRASRKTSTLSEQLLVENSGRVKGKSSAAS